jgi:hypothetical protein
MVAPQHRKKKETIPDYATTVMGGDLDEEPIGDMRVTLWW